MPNSPERTAESAVRDALWRLRTSNPEATAVIELRLKQLEEQNQLFASDDAFKAFVLAQAHLAGATNLLLQRLDSGVLADLARAEAERAEAARLAEAARAENTLTVRQIFSQPVMVAIVSAISAGVVGILELARFLWTAP